MHVNEVPSLLFEEFSDHVESINQRHYAADKHPHLRPKEIREEYDDIELVIGSNVDDIYMRLEDLPDDIARLSFYSSKDAAVLSWLAPIAMVESGRYRTGVWAGGSGEQHEQSIRLKLFEQIYGGPESFSRLEKVQSFLGRIAHRLSEIQESGIIEESRFFEKDIEI